MVFLWYFIEMWVKKRYTPLWLMFTVSKQCHNDIKPERSLAMITIGIKEVVVNKKIEIDEENFNFGAIEDKIYEVGLGIARRVLEGVLAILDDRIRAGRQRKEFENRGKGEKYLVTRMGDIRYSRTRYHDMSAGGYRYLLDEALGLEKRQTVSIGRRRLEARLAVATGSYRSAVSELEASTGSSRSHEAIRGVVLEEGERLRKAEECELQREYNLDSSYVGEPHDVVYIEADGTQIHHQGSDRKKGKGLEVKVGICYTGKCPRYRGGSGKAKLLENKYIHLDIKPGTGFMEDMSLVTEREVGLSKARHVIVGGDGAAWIRKGMDVNFADAHYKLCDYHLNEQVTTALSGMVDVKRRVKSQLNKYDIDGALSSLWHGAMRCSDHTKFEKLTKLYKYIDSNREGIWDVSKFGDGDIGVVIESLGGIENTVDNAVADRFKKHGFRWGEIGARSLLKIQQALLNGRWESWWYEERNKPVKVDRGAITPLSASEVNKGSSNKTVMEEIPLPCFHGPDQSKPWVKALKGMTKIDRL